jgi:hypothetical protein
MKHKHGVPFQYDPKTRMPKRVNLMKLKCVDYRFGLGYKFKREYYKWVASRKREARMAKIEGRELGKEGLTILPLSMTFPGYLVIRSGMEALHISALECQDKKQNEEVKVKAKDEMLSQLSMNTIDEVLAKSLCEEAS